MAKNIKTYYLFSFALVLMLSACYKDIGNYSYHPINVITLQLDNSYTGTYGKKFYIKPVIQLTKDSVVNTYDTTKYSYEWSTMNNAPNVIFANQHVVLANTHDLDIELTAIPPASTYTLYYRVTDKKTGMQWQTSANLTVTTSIYEGWLALCSVNGKSRLDMASYANNAYAMLPGVLDSVGSDLSMAGKPVDVTYCDNAAQLGAVIANGIYVTTSEGTNRIDPESFKWNANMNIKFDMMASVPSNFAADAIAPAGSYVNYMVSGGNVYYYSRIFQFYWGTTVNVVSGEAIPYKAAPFIATPAPPGAALAYGAVFYDTDNKRFVRVAGGTAVSSVMPANMPLFNYTTGMDLVYMEYVPYNGGEVFSVLHDNSTNKYYLARFTLNASINQTYFTEITGADFNLAEHFAVSPDYGYLFYSVGGKVYEYDMGLRQSFLMLDKGTSAVSLLKFQHFITSNYITGTNGRQLLYNKLAVASYDPTQPEGSNGILELYNVPQTNGALTMAQSLTGFGKIVSLTYRER